MKRIDDNKIECEGKIYRIVNSKSGTTCSRCSCKPCRDNGRLYSATCYALIGNNGYLRRGKNERGH